MLVNNDIRLRSVSTGRLLEGFALIELLVVLAIIGVLATIAGPIYSDYVERVRVAQAIRDIGAISKSITIYGMSNGDQYPDSLAVIGMDAMLDPWDNPYQYLNLTASKDGNGNGKGKGKDVNVGKARKDHNLVPINSDFDLYSMGKDGASVSPLTAKASRDDIVRANNGRFIGRASDY
ncbi:MAG: prepilin-type N-terminal cleavage/methylation domain-containing protein [Burkholderiales bacterium]|nr:prepilin-type N-terminal cleavage/methylation domain-containing protein [Burkholderiales bacterium]